MLPIVRRAHHNAARRRENQELILMRRQIRDHYDPFNLPERRFMELFRLSKDMARQLIQIVRPHLLHPRTIRGISEAQRVLVALRFYGTGNYQRGLGDEYNFGMAQPSVHLCIHQVTDAISEHLVNEFIRFPITIAERNEKKQRFLQKFEFPGTVGAIDGTHIAILKPNDAEEHNYFNRKGYHSINCQIIVDADMKIINIFPNFGGATHDSFIWNHSEINNFMQNGLEHGEQSWLIGDSGYPQRPFLMTPFLNPAAGTPEARYNSAHIRARNVVERTIGVWKIRFRSILKERTSRYDKLFVCKIIKTCAVLHNMCIHENVPFPAEDLELPDDQPPNDMFNNPRQRNEGMLARERIVYRYFRN